MYTILGSGGCGLAGPDRSLDRFNEAKQLWDQENPANYAVTVSFDRQYGFPSDATIDYIKNAVDDELSLKASNFVVLPVP
ncbi:MAG: hypothetical protein EXR94_01795 [Gemmatimonadetes bacterium]|nr:hypothetical protein [Gemmatimonadota bacterium]